MVVGFDNGIDAVTHGFSSFDFNGRACMASAVNYVLHPLQFRGQPNPMSIAGFVDARERA